MESRAVAWLRAVAAPSLTAVLVASFGAASSGGASGVTFSDQGLTCTSAPGETPLATCDVSDEKACGAAIPEGCSLSPKCGDATTCEPFTHSSGPVSHYRMRTLEVAAPTVLASTFVSANEVDARVSLPQTPDASCGEDGSGTFNWLITVDHERGTVTTGGAPFSTDPFDQGYCYARSKIGGVAVEPVTMSATFAGDTLQTGPASATLNLPIFFSQTDITDLVILPIRQAAFRDVTISADGDCIGSVNNRALQAGTCTDVDPRGPESCARWHTAGVVSGYIRLDDAEKIWVAPMSESLCALLTGTSDNGHCPAAALTTGDYCSATNSAGGCRDSVWTASTFAASAVNINDGSGIAVCGGRGS